MSLCLHYIFICIRIPSVSGTSIQRVPIGTIVSAPVPPRPKVSAPMPPRPALISPQVRWNQNLYLGEINGNSIRQDRNEPNSIY